MNCIKSSLDPCWTGSRYRGSICREVSGPGCSSLLAQFFAKEVIFGNKRQLSAGICLWRAVGEGCCLSLSCWMISFLILSRNALPLQWKEDVWCFRNLCRALSSRWSWGWQHSCLQLWAVQMGSATFVSQFSWLFLWFVTGLFFLKANQCRGLCI